MSELQRVSARVGGSHGTVHHDLTPPVLPLLLDDPMVDNT